MGAAPPEAPRQDGESAPTAAGVAVPRQSQPCAAYGASAASDAGSTAGSRARAGRGAAALPGRGDPPLDLGWQESEGTATLHSISSMAAYREKSFEELRWEHYSKDNNPEAQPPAEPPAAAQHFLYIGCARDYAIGSPIHDYSPGVITPVLSQKNYLRIGSFSNEPLSPKNIAGA